MPNKLEMVFKKKKIYTVLFWIVVLFVATVWMCTHVLLLGKQYFTVEFDGSILIELTQFFTDFINFMLLLLLLRIVLILVRKEASVTNSWKLFYFNAMSNSSFSFFSFLTGHCKYINICIFLYWCLLFVQKKSSNLNKKKKVWVINIGFVVCFFFFCLFNVCTLTFQTWNNCISMYFSNTAISFIFLLIHDISQDV